MSFESGMVKKVFIGNDNFYVRVRDHALIRKYCSDGATSTVSDDYVIFARNYKV